MSKSLRLILALALTLGAGTLVAGWSGTGIGTCTNGTISFTPFETWDETGWSRSYPFSGEWYDDANSEEGVFEGSWEIYTGLPGYHISEGYWYRHVNDDTIRMGNYEILFNDSNDTCYGWWDVTLEDWYALPVGIPPISGFYSD